jgi:hypothetical protein
MARRDLAPKKLRFEPRHDQRTPYAGGAGLANATRPVAARRGHINTECPRPASCPASVGLTQAAPPRGYASTDGVITQDHAIGAPRGACCRHQVTCPATRL